MRRIGITTTIPVEVIYAAGCVPVDLNNVFITSPRPQELVEKAEIAGYPRNTCGWIKGLYATALQMEIKEVVAVTQGDCSNTQALMETLELVGVRIIPFAFPYDRDIELLRLQIERLMEYFGVNWSQVRAAKKRLDEVRALVWELDRLTWEENLVDGFTNHLYQVSCSDFNGDPEKFAEEVKQLLQEVKEKKPLAERVRLGYLGVPPIIPRLYNYLEEYGARVVFNEIQRQFTMPFPGVDLIEQYRCYTYPYQVFARLADIEREVKRRQLQGLIHYTQSFCFRQIEDLIFRQKLKLPILTLEGDKPGELDARSKMRLETFIEILG